MTSYDDRALLGKARGLINGGERDVQKAIAAAAVSIASSAERIATALEMQAAIQLHYVQENEDVDDGDLLGQYARAIVDTPPL